MRRVWYVWTAFGLALAVALGGMAWVTVSALRLDRAEAEARRQAELEDRVRLALWRMDSALTPLIGRESGHPASAYAAFYPAERAYTKMFAAIRRGEVLMPSPLLNPASPRVLLYFQWGPDAEPTSPQAPLANMRDLAEATGYTSAGRIERAVRRLAELREQFDKHLGRDGIVAALPSGDTTPPAAGQQGGALQQMQAENWGQQLALAPNNVLDQQTAQANDPLRTQGAQAAPQQKQQERSTFEAQARFTRARDAYLANTASQSPIPKVAKTAQPPAHGVGGVMRPLWVGESLILARRVTVGKAEHVQGCWLDWPGMRDALLDDVRDLLPAASLVPERGQAADSPARRLASLPVRLEPGAVASEPRPGPSPIGMALLIGWGCVAVAAVALGGLLVGAVSLSERRGAFVSAVTHELRTPLTTFRLYTEMLSDGMVSEEAKRRQYITTLRGEAVRLSHLVENVLAYARLERGRGRSRAESLALGDVVDRVTRRLAERAARADMELAVAADDATLAARVRTDSSLVEQILLNLVDNACKYAASADDRRIHLEAERRDGRALLRVRDHGPGVAPAEATRLFRPFSKSAREAAHTAPGIGLGLALSRRLARDMGGDLRLDPAVTDGASFTLELPLDGT